MNENQREFTINKIEKYQDEVDSIRKRQILPIVVASMCVTLVIIASMMFLEEYRQNPNSFKSLMELLCIMAVSGGGISMVNEIFKGTAKQVGLEMAIQDLQKQLEIDDREEIILKRR